MTLKEMFTDAMTINSDDWKNVIRFSYPDATEFDNEFDPLVAVDPGVSAQTTNFTYRTSVDKTGLTVTSTPVI